MARAGWLMVKWLLFPVALAAVGYYFVGPRIGKISVPTASTPIPPAESTEGTPSATETTTSSYPAPDVDVQVGSHAQVDPQARRRRRRRSKPKPPVETAPPPADTAPPDSGGSGGAATGGP